MIHLAFNIFLMIIKKMLPVVSYKKGDTLARSRHAGILLLTKLVNHRIEESVLALNHEKGAEIHEVSFTFWYGGSVQFDSVRLFDKDGYELLAEEDYAERLSEELDVSLMAALQITYWHKP